MHIVDDGLESWARIPVFAIQDYWVGMGLGYFPLAWERAPIFVRGTEPAQALMVHTAKNRLYRLSHYSAFHRLMVRDGFLKLVFENGREEPVLEAYQLDRPSAAPAHQIVPPPLGLVDATGNVLPFKRKPLFKV